MHEFDKLINFNNEVFKSYAFWSGVLVLKMMGMSFLTGLLRLIKKVFANPEDLYLAKEITGPKASINFNDPDVERTRRAHRNDLEIVMPFFTIGFLYVLTNPEAYIAVNIFRIFAISRMLYTLVYAVFAIRQPARSVCFNVNIVCMAYMVVKTLMYYS